MAKWVFYPVSSVKGLNRHRFLRFCRLAEFLDDATIIVDDTPRKKLKYLAGDHNYVHADLIEWVKENDPDHVVIWNGGFKRLSDDQTRIREEIPADKLVFCEIAWLPQSNHIYLDSKGVNGGSTLCYSRPETVSTALSAFKRNYRTKEIDRKPKTVLVPLQLEDDTSIVNYSPYFKTMNSWMKFVAEWIPEEYEIICKVHPMNPSTHWYQVPKRFKVVRDNLDHWLASCEFMVAINSTVTLEALVYDLPVIAFGQGVFTGNDVVTEATPDDEFAEPEQKNTDAFLSMLLERQIDITSDEEIERKFVEGWT